MAGMESAIIGMAAAVSISATALAAAWAETRIGTAAVGAIAEKEQLFGKALILTVIPETLVIFGFLVAFLILGLAK